MKDVKIAPSILGVPCLETPAVIKKLLLDGADLIHYDVMDGKFVERKNLKTLSQELDEIIKKENKGTICTIRKEELEKEE